MSINQDAFFLLAVIYGKQYIEQQDLGSDGLAEFTGFDHNRVLDAIRYLQGEKLKLIEREEKNVLLSGVILNLECTSKGINIIENPEVSFNDYGIKFEINFIINANFESLIKAEFDSLIKLSLF